MGTFADEAEVNRYLGDIFTVALGHDEVGPKVRDAGLALRINHTEPDATIHVDMANGVVTTGAEARGQEGDVALTMSSDDGHLFWMGELNFPLAMARGRIKADGAVTKLVKILPLSRPLFGIYREILEQDDRQDLLAVAG